MATKDSDKGPLPDTIANPGNLYQPLASLQLAYLERKCNVEREHRVGGDDSDVRLKMAKQSTLAREIDDSTHWFDHGEQLTRRLILQAWSPFVPL
jgi:hypothetical protein